MTTIIAPSFEDLRVQSRNDEVLDAAFFDRRFQLISATLGTLAETVNNLGLVEDNLIKLGLIKLNDTLGPILNKVHAAADLGFLISTSDSLATLVLNQATQFEINYDSGASDIFMPTPFLSVTRSGLNTLNQFAICRLLSWDRDARTLIVEPIYVSPTLIGEHNDWNIADSGGMFLGMVDILDQAISAKADLAAAQIILDQAISEVIGGPVVSVNGKVGVVSLGMGDIANLVSTMAGKASASHGHNISEVSGLQAAIDGKIGNNVTSTINVGYTVAPYNAGTKTSGTFTPNPALSNYQYLINGGAFTLAAPSTDCAIEILVTNSMNAGEITFTGFTYAIANYGDALTTTTGQRFVISIKRIASISTLTIKALQ